MGKQPSKGFERTHSETEMTSVTGNNHLFVIGIDTYEHCGQLSNAVRDAESFRDLLLEKYQFEPAYLTALLNKEATRRKIANAFRRLTKEIGPNDNLVVYFSGHGHYDEHYKSC